MVTCHSFLASRTQRSHRTKAFTLVEILIVVVILGILAAIVVPQFVSAAGEARQSSVKMDLHRIRTQLEVYRQQHGGQFPTLADFTNQLTLPSDVNGTTAAIGTPGYLNGPYIMEIPNNPLAGTNTVGDGAPGSSAWYYNEATGEFRANDSAPSRLY